MPTRAGDATASAEGLLELLKLHCPGVAEETLRRLADAAVAVGEAAGEAGDGAGGPQPLRWSPLTLGQIPGVQQVVSAAKVPVQVIAAVLEFVAGILDVVSALLIGLPDPFRALILAAIELIETILRDLLNTGGYLYFDAPGLLSNIATLRDIGMPEPELPQWLAGDKPLEQDRPADGFAQWAYRFRQSFDDPGDDERPTFSDGAPVEALFVVVTAPQIPDLAAFGPLLSVLFDASAFEKAWDNFASTYPVWPDDPDRARLRGDPVAPDWHAYRLRDIGGADHPLRLLEKIPVWLRNILLNVDGVIDLIRALVAAVKQKIEVLRQIIAIIQQVIDALAALTSTGLHALFVHTDEGVDGLVKAFLEATNRPNTGPDGKAREANAVAGVCLLAGTSEIAPLWALLGQGKPAAAAFAGLTEDWAALSDRADKSLADAKALASDAWHGAEQGGGVDRSGIAGLAETLVDTVDGLTAEEVRRGAADDRGGLVTGIEHAMAQGAQLDPATLAYVEATRRARRRGNRSMAMSLGARPSNAGGAT